MQRLLALLAVAAAVGLGAQPLEIVVDPEWPDYDDAITLYIGGTWDSLCTPRDPKVSVEGTTVRVRLSVPGGACPKVSLPLRLEVPLGRLARGLYEIVVEVVDPSGAARILGSREFYVAQPNWLYWMSNRPLAWEDFLAPPPRQRGEAVAQVCLSLTYEYGATARAEPGGPGLLVRLTEVRVHNRVDRNRSWALPEHRRPDVLEHEQIHFDINEVYRRLLQEELDRLAARLELRAFGVEEAWQKLREEVDKVYMRFWRKCQEVHDLFDKEVRERGPMAQREWRERVNRWLRNPREAPQP